VQTIRRSIYSDIIIGGRGFKIEKRRETLIHARVKHPHAIGFREFDPQPPTIVTEFAANGTLASNLPLIRFGVNRIAKMVT
jgi:hypothetical protein